MLKIGLPFALVLLFLRRCESARFYFRTPAGTVVGHVLAALYAFVLFKIFVFPSFPPQFDVDVGRFQQVTCNCGALQSILIFS